MHERSGRGARRGRARDSRTPRKGGRGCTRYVRTARCDSTGGAGGGQGPRWVVSGHVGTHDVRATGPPGATKGSRDSRGTLDSVARQHANAHVGQVTAHVPTLCGTVGKPWRQGTRRRGARCSEGSVQCMTAGASKTTRNIVPLKIGTAQVLDTCLYSHQYSTHSTRYGVPAAGTCMLVPSSTSALY